MPDKAVPRQRLIDTLEREIPHYRLVLLSAPAGYGKTTLLTQWAHSSQHNIAWVSLDPDDDDPIGFIRYLLRGWQHAQPDDEQKHKGLLLGSLAQDVEAVLPAFLNAAAEMPDHVIFVLDDYHVIEDPAVHDALTYLLDHLPPTLHFVLSGRDEPPLPLARYRARNEMLEFRSEDLRFSLPETRDFVSQLPDVDLADDRITSLHDELEGWIAGLHLALLALRYGDVTPESVSGKHRYIADYLGDEVLGRQDEEVQEFLLRTSLLDPLCESLCDAVVGDTAGREMLAHLLRENLFLTPLDSNWEWFRYHPVFAEFLQDALHRRYPDSVAELHGRAARWYLAHELPDSAFRHAVAASEVELVIDIAEQYLPSRLSGGEIKSVRQWLAQIPDAWQTEYPILGLFQAGLLLATGRFEACAHYLDRFEERARSVDGNGHNPLAKATALRCYLACFHNDLASAESLAEKALAGLPPDDIGFRPGIFGALGDTYRRNGHWREAEESYLQLLDKATAPAYRTQVVHIYGALADLNLRRGRLDAASGYWREALAVIQNPDYWGMFPLPLIGWVNIRLGELYYERDNLAQAQQHISYGLECAELGDDVRSLIAGYLIAGRIKLTEGDIEASAAYLEQARPLVEQAQFAHWVSRFKRLQIELWLAQDKLATAVDWSERMLQDAALPNRPASEVAQLAIARVLIVTRDASSLQRAQTMLRQLIQDSEAAGRIAVTIEALALQAIACWQQGNQASALTALTRALRLSKPEGYVRLFADLGLPMARVLQEAQARNVMSATVTRLLAVFGVDSAESAGVALPEPLTRRESEILAFMASGLTNREIAEALVIAPGTVKKHTSHIYGKLGVNNRTEAAAKARELNLLDQGD